MRWAAAAHQARAGRGRPTAWDAEAGRRSSYRRLGALVPVGARGAGVQLVGRWRAAAAAAGDGRGAAEAAEEQQGRGRMRARAHGEGEPGAGEAGARAARRARPGPQRSRRPDEEVELPARAQPAAQRVGVVARLAVLCLAAATSVVIDRRFGGIL